MSSDGPERAEPAEAAEAVDDKSLLDRLRDSGVGTQDPNIVGDAGPGDTPPGADVEGGHVFTEDQQSEPAPES